MREQPDLIVPVPVPIVPEPHVVPQLVREDTATGALGAEAKSVVYVGAADDVVIVDNQVHEIGADPVAQGVHLVEVTVRRVPEPAQVDCGVACLDIGHLPPLHQRYAVVDPARPIG